jgi:RNA-dependent RNA polymerase
MNISQSGTQDRSCIKLAELCSQAVDYPKNGIPVNIDGSPRWLIPYKPDWHAAEDSAPRRMDYYESTRALGKMYRAITLDHSIDPQSTNTPPQAPLSDPISVVLKERIKRYLPSYTDPEGSSQEIPGFFKGYVDELQYICSIHTVSITPGTRLMEEEVVVGTILAKCSQKRWRKTRMYAMHVHASALVKDIQHKLLPVANLEEASAEQLVDGLERAWRAWDFSRRSTDKFGGNSFGLVALAVIFDCLEGLEKTA